LSRDLAVPRSLKCAGWGGCDTLKSFGQQVESRFTIGFRARPAIESEIVDQEEPEAMKPNDAVDEVREDDVGEVACLV
jgi:predicted aminopeptidase